MKPVIHTYTGKTINPFDLQPDDICIEDIAHALSNVNRFIGHPKKPISVAHHSLYVSHLCEGTPFELQGLLHDASEAYLGDVSKWIKMSPEMAHYRGIEARVEIMIYEKFNCPVVMSEPVELADRIMVRYEALRGLGFEIQHPNYPPLTQEEIILISSSRIGLWGFGEWEDVEDLFLDRFEELYS